MNLELLDPFGRQVPDRIDSTIDLPATLHFRHTNNNNNNNNNNTNEKKSKGSSSNNNNATNNTANAAATEETDWKAAYHLAFNRRGTYVAVGYGSGAIAVHNVLSRTLSALYRSNDDNDDNDDNDNDNEDNTATANTTKGLGISNVSWSRRSRTLLAGSVGDDIIRLLDTTHPFGPEEGSRALLVVEPSRGENEDDGAGAAPAPPSTSTTTNKEVHHYSREERVVEHTFEQTQTTSFADIDLRYTFVHQSRHLKPITVRMGQEIAPQPRVRLGNVPSDARGLAKYPSIHIQLPQKVGGSMQVNPRVPTGGLVVLEDGSLVLFWQHPSVWVDGSSSSSSGGGGQDDDNDDYETADPILVPLWGEGNNSTSRLQEHPITCAAFDPHGDRIYAATKSGRTLGFDVSVIWKVLLADPTQKPRRVPVIQPHFNIPIPLATASWHLLVSRNGKFFVINSADGAIRLFSTQECWEKPESVEKPTWVFQDVVSKVKFASCDLSGDGEYVVGGANGDDYKYELYIWNTSTGVLMDKLTGPPVQLYSVAWHPTRSFVAVSTADGLLDVWGPRIDWTNFAPDFQALPMNVEYIEGEDELDVDPNGTTSSQDNAKKSEENQDTILDVCTVEPVPVFASDSEKEDEVFVFETKVRQLLTGRRFSKPSTVEE